MLHSDLKLTDKWKLDRVKNLHRRPKWRTKLALDPTTTYILLSTWRDVLGYKATQATQATHMNWRDLVPKADHERFGVSWSAQRTSWCCGFWFLCSRMFVDFLLRCNVTCVLLSVVLRLHIGWCGMLHKVEHDRYAQIWYWTFLLWENISSVRNPLGSFGYQVPAGVSQGTLLRCMAAPQQQNISPLESM